MGNEPENGPPPQLRFPRPRDGERFAYGLSGPEPAGVWERFSPAYKGQLSRIVTLLGDVGFAPAVGEAGSEDGEYVRAVCQTNDGVVFFTHLEAPDNARLIAAMDDAVCRKGVREGWIGA